MASAKPLVRLLFILFFSCLSLECFSQDLYSARGYWEESTKKTYLDIKQKQETGQALTENESNYLLDYEQYLSNYYNRLSDTEKERYELMKAQWNRELGRPRDILEPDEFEWRAWDRTKLLVYGLYYGSSIPVIAEIGNEAAFTAIPLLTGGLWLLGPTFNPGKYEGISQTTIRAGNSGKFLGLMNGAFLGLAIAGDSGSPEKAVLGLSTLGSIGLGEAAFQWQKKQQISDGHISITRHYSLLGPGVALAAAVSTRADNANLAGGLLLAGGAAGVLIGNGAARKYDYTRGDVASISSLSLITAGIGFTLISGAIEGDSRATFALVPAATAIAGTLIGQQLVRGVYLTRKQGSNLSLATSGAAAIGLGLAVLIDNDLTYPTLLFGLPSGLALLTHQLLFNSYKRQNLGLGALRIRDDKGNYRLSMEVKPENYFVNQRITLGKYSPEAVARLQQPMLKMRLSF